MSEEVDMYVSLKSRQRRPSAKVLAAGSVSASETPGPSTPSSTVSSGSIKSARTLSLQTSVAETVVDESSEIEAREFSVTLETLSANLWKSHGFHQLGKKRLLTKSPLSNSNKVAQKLLQSAVESPRFVSAEEPKQLVALVVDTEPEPIKKEEEEEEEEDEEEAGICGDDEESNRSEETFSSVKDCAVSPASSPEVNKRKRGRPFKGQEKPVEERLMIEACKIRRLIDDIIRKGTCESQLCLRLRNIARDLDEVLAGNSSLASAEPALVDTGLPHTLENDQQIHHQKNDSLVE